MSPLSSVTTAIRGVTPDDIFYLRIEAPETEGGARVASLAATEDGRPRVSMALPAATFTQIIIALVASLPAADQAAVVQHLADNPPVDLPDTIKRLRVRMLNADEEDVARGAERTMAMRVQAVKEAKNLADATAASTGDGTEPAAANMAEVLSTARFLLGE